MRQSRALFASIVTTAAVAIGGCWTPEPPREEGTFRFAVFGDGPYSWRENGRFQRVIDALNDRPLAFVVHVGDIMWQRCSDAAYRNRRQAIDRINHPVIYTPGDNEWSDCVDPFAGRYDPLERLASLRKTFFDSPTLSLGGKPLALEAQSAHREYREFPEHARWVYGGLVFATIHVVNSANGRREFRGRGATHDDEIGRRTRAAVAWLRETFAAAADSGAPAVVVAFHAGIFDRSPGPDRDAYAPIYDALVELATRFEKPVLVIHGDDHTYTIDRPFHDPATGATVENLQRLQTFGSPDIGWVDVVVDPARTEPFRFEPNLTPWWMWWCARVPCSLSGPAAAVPSARADPAFGRAFPATHSELAAS